MDSVVVFVINFPLESDLSVGQRYPHFEQLSLDGFVSRQSWNKFLYRASKQATSFDCGSWSCQHLIFDFDCLYQFICHHYHFFFAQVLETKTIVEEHFRKRFDFHLILLLFFSQRTKIIDGLRGKLHYSPQNIAVHVRFTYSDVMQFCTLYS